MNYADSIYSHLLGFVTESGFRFTQLDVAWKSWGRLNEARDNVVVICHALTGHANAEEWFSGLFTENSILNPDEQFIICMNVPGSCYGSTSPQSVNPETGRRYGSAFPVLTIRDVVRAQQLVLDHMRVKQIQLVIGGSMGGMQALEFAAMDKRVQSAAVIAAGARHEAWAIGISEAQRQAIYADSRWKGGDYAPDESPVQELSAARSMAMLTYRAPQQFSERFGRDQRDDQTFQVESYLRYQGGKLTQRFDPLSYVRLTQMMDTHDAGRGRGGLDKALAAIQIPVLVVGIDSDLLYPVAEQRALAQKLPNSFYREIRSEYGHDAFLIEFRQLNNLLLEFRHHIKHRAA